MTKSEQIIKKAVEILKVNPQGIRYSQLIGAISEAFPDMSIDTIRGNVWDLDKTLPNEVYKPERGLWRHISFKDVRAAVVVQAGVNEEDFYEPFVQYLKTDLEECTQAISLGGNKFKDKWATPDVIGVERHGLKDIVRPTTPIIVSAEIKISTNTSDLLTAFGQACAYKLFSHKVYLVIPTNSDIEDKSRIESLCLIFGIGLVFFDGLPNSKLSFEPRVRAIKHEPDMYYVNKYMKELPDEELTKLFN